MFYNILDKKRLAILPLLGEFKDRFYIAGGTALALQIGHRDSIDFDFFGPKDIDTTKLFAELSDIFFKHTIVKIQEEKNTLTVIVDDDIRLSFFGYRYDLLGELIREKYISIAPIEDIGCMKLSAIVGRASSKDYIDLYYILQKIELKKLLDLAEKKFPDIDTNLILKSLVYFDDVDVEPILFVGGNEVSFEEVKKFLEAEVRKIAI